MNANERIGWINKLNKKDAYIKTLTEGIRDLNTKIYQDKMAADAVNERKNKQIAEQQAEIEALKKLVSEMKYEKSSGVYEMNNEPVAWIDKNTGKPRMEGFIQTDHDIPLYIHPHPDNLGLAESIIKQQQLKIDNLYENNARLDAEIDALKAHPAKELNDGGEPVKNATYWKRQYNLMATQNDNLKSGLYHANEQIKYLESHPVKELHLSLQKSKQTGELLAVTYTDDEHRIVEVLWEKPPVKDLTDEEILEIGEHCDNYWDNCDLIDFARAILKRAQEK